MAVETQTQGTTGDGRALGAALSAPAPFTSRAASMALHASDRHVDRWAPESGATTRSRSLGTLSFVDRLLGPWLSGVAAPRTAGSQSGGGGGGEGRLPSVSWVFPRPWYQDELDWMAAAREGGDQARSGMLTTRGTYAAPGMPPAMPSVVAPSVSSYVAPGALAGTVRSAGQTYVAVSDQPLTRRTLQSELAYVAPSFAGGAATLVPQGFDAGGDATVAPAPTYASSTPAGISVAAPGRAPAAAISQYGATMAPAAAIAAMSQQRALRAWSPQVSFAAAQAAEVMAGVVGGVERAALSTSGSAAASHSPILEGLSYVAPAELAPDYYGAGSTTTRAPAVASSASTAPIARAIAQLAAAQAVANAAPAGRASTPEALVASQLAARAAVADTVAPTRAMPAEAAASPSPAVVAYRAEQARVVEELSRREAPVAASVAPAAATPPTSFEELVRIAGSSPAAAHAMRAVELMARSALTGTVAPASGPRVALPAGLGGAVIGHEAAIAAHRPMVTMTPGAEAFGGAQLATFDAQGAPMESTAPAARTAPSWQPVWTAPYAAPTMAAPAGGVIAPRATMAHVMPTAALSAIAGDRPAAVDHLAWTDRWLARFAGASPTSLAAVDVASERSLAVPRALAAGAPEVVFVVPGLDEPAAVQRRAAAAATPSRAPLAVAPPVRAASTEPQRYADEDSIPDEVFAAISRSARPRMPSPAPGSTASAATPMAPTLVPPAPEHVVRPTIADRIARSAPTAPDAGLYAGLASSPMAPALAGVLPLPAAPVFDPRALYGGGVVSAFLAGAIAGVRGGAAMTMWPATAATPWAMPWIDAAPGMSKDASALGGDAPTLGVAARAPATPFVSPDFADAGVAASATTTTAPSAPTGPAAVSRAAREAVAPSDGAADVRPSASMPGVPAWVAAAMASADPSIWSLRAELAPSATTSAAASFAPGVGASGTMLDAPLGDLDGGGWTARPGMTAELAHGFAVHTERTAADLSFDFVSPEQVLAARVYGFGAVEAAQAARLAVSGPAGLAAMASAMDLTFLRQLHIESERPGAPGADADRPRARRAAPAMPAISELAAADVAEGRVAEGRAAEVRAAEARAAAPAMAMPAMPAASSAATMPGVPASVFGVGRRLPRGSFLWPSGAVAALDLRADLPEGAAILQVAALELLAANAVAEMGVLVAPSASDDAGEATAAAPGARASRAVPSSLGMPSGAMPSGAMPSGAMPMAATSGGAPPVVGSAAEPAVEQVAEAIAVPTAHRARFESIYLSLSRSAAGQSLSPSVRAARALAIAAHQGRDDGGSTAQERAFAAWSVMPLVFSGGDAAPGQGEAAAPGAPAHLGRERPAMDVYAPDAGSEDTGPGLSRLAARAGEAIGSYVHPTVGEVERASSGAASTSDRGGPTTRTTREPFVHELIRSGRGFTRAGGGEVEIPGWFEAAAKRMLEQRGLGENLSLAELTLVASAPTAQVAASRRGEAAPAAAGTPGGAASKDGGDKPDIDKIAAEVYAEILKLLDVARERSGDPWT